MRQKYKFTVGTYLRTLSGIVWWGRSPLIHSQTLRSRRKSLFLGGSPTESNVFQTCIKYKHESIFGLKPPPPPGDISRCVLGGKIEKGEENNKETERKRKEDER